MFLSHEATDRRDKVYGLLGMCSDPHMTATLQSDYSLGWKELFEKLVWVPVGCQDVTVSREQQLAFVCTNGFVLGTVDNNIDTGGFWSGWQCVYIKLANTIRHRWHHQTPNYLNCLFRNRVETHDLICLLHDKSRIVVVRPV